jgi:hypothetical protein
MLHAPWAAQSMPAGRSTTPALAAGRLVGAAQEGVAGVSERDDPAAAVVRCGAPLGVPGLLQIVDDADDRVRVAEWGGWDSNPRSTDYES